MSKIRDILAVKGTQVYSITPASTILEAAQRMNEHKIGSLAVVEDGRLAGIITERDLLTRVIVERRNPVSTRVADVMTREVVCCTAESTLDEVRGVMKSRRIRHVPVTDEARRLTGIVSLGDLNVQHTHDCEATIHVMEAYIAGRA